MSEYDFPQRFSSFAVGNLSIDRSASIARREYIVRANARYFSATTKAEEFRVCGISTIRWVAPLVESPPWKGDRRYAPGTNAQYFSESRPSAYIERNTVYLHLGVTLENRGYRTRGLSCSSSLPVSPQMADGGNPFDRFREYESDGRISVALVEIW